MKKHVASMHENFAEPISYPCNICNSVFITEQLLQDHMVSHDEPQIKCEYCGVPCQSETVLREHIINFHEETVILYTLGKQVDEVHEQIDKFETSNNDILKAIRNILDTQNEIKQELFLVRNFQETSLKTKQANEKIKVASKDISIQCDFRSDSRSYASAASVEKDKVKDDRSKKNESRDRRKSSDRVNVNRKNFNKKDDLHKPLTRDKNYYDHSNRPSRHQYNQDRCHFPTTKVRDNRSYRYQPQRNIHHRYIPSQPKYHASSRPRPWISRWRSYPHHQYHESRNEYFERMRSRNTGSRYPPYEDYMIPTFNRFSPLGNFSRGF